MKENLTYSTDARFGWAQQGGGGGQDLDGWPTAARGDSLPETLRDRFSLALRQHRNYLMEPEAKEILEGIGIETTGFLVARSEDEAVAMSSDLGYPVVLKIVSPDVVHKTEGGGVKLHLKNAGDVRRAYREILNAFRSSNSAGIAVQRMAKPGLEAIVGVTRDPSFGAVLMFGLGGVFVEVLRDVTFRVLPITAKDAAAMIEEIKGYPLLKGYRGQPVDLPALKRLLLTVSQLVTACPEIAELDLNPVFLYPSGCTAVDARIFLDRPSEHRPAPSSPQRDLRDFFTPRSIAVLGATDARNKLGYNVFWNLVSHGFGGALYPINPGRESVLGIKAYRSIGEVPADIDLAIVIVPAGAVLQAIEDCCAKGVRSIVVETAGFAETGEEGRRAQARIEEIVREKGCRILGPNCSGIINTHHNMVQSIGILQDLGQGNVGLIAQAGVYAAGILTGLRNVLDFGIVATIGNKIDVSETGILEHLGQDDHIAVVGMYMEDVRDGRHFVDTARRVTAKKPVIVLKAGRTEAGRKAVSSHTASLAGNEEVNNAALRQSGVIRARDNEHLFALLRAFSKQPLPMGNRVMVITYTGSLGVAAADTLALNEMRLAPLEPFLEKRLRNILPTYANITNPVDCSFSMTPEQVQKLVEIGIQSEDVHSFIVIIPGETLGAFVATLKDIPYKGKPIVCCVACKEFMMTPVVEMERAGIPVYATAEMAAEVLGEMYHYGVQQRRAAAEAVACYVRREPFLIDNEPVRLRLIDPGDTELWTEFVQSCSPRSLWLRFLAPFVPTPERALRFCDVDPEKEIGLVAETTGRDNRKLVGIARLVKEVRPDEAEYAVLVSDAWQKKRLGYILSEQCIQLARSCGFRTVRSETVQENFAMLRILRRYQFEMEARDENMLFLSLRL